MKFEKQLGYFHFEKDRFAKNAQNISKFFHEVLIVMKLSQKKPQVKGLNKNYHDLVNTFNKNLPAVRENWFIR